MRNILWRAMPLACATVALLATACDREPTGPSQLAAPTNEASVVKSAALRAVEGTVGPGALYGMYVPENWNHDLVLYAHGYCGFTPDQNSAAACYPGNDPGSVELRDKLLADGYAVAWSSYSDWGMMVKDGAIRTAQLKGLFTSQFGKPAHTYLMSMSLGGAIVMRMAEQHPAEYDGVLPVCGIVGGLNYQMSYYWTMKALVQQYYPGIVPNQLMSTNDFFGTVGPQLIGAIFSDLGKAADLAGVDQVELAYTNPEELLWGLVYPVVFATSDRFAGDLTARLHGRNFFDNSGVQYSGSADDAALNAGIARFTADHDALNLLNSWYEPTGRVRIPVLTLHTARDPIVPIRHEQEYARLAAAAGSSAYLVQRTIDRFGHCAFTADEQATALRDLATWVRTGQRPLN